MIHSPDRISQVTQILSQAATVSSQSFEWLRERTDYIDVFFFPPITQSCSVSDVLFTGGRGVSDISVLK